MTVEISNVFIGHSRAMRSVVVFSDGRNVASARAASATRIANGFTTSFRPRAATQSPAQSLSCDRIDPATRTTLYSRCALASFMGNERAMSEKQCQCRQLERRERSTTHRP